MTREVTRSGCCAASQIAGMAPPVEVSSTARSQPAASITARASRPQRSTDGSVPVGSGSERPRPPASKRIRRENSAIRSV
jgi:hypothetical protein